MSSVGRDNDAQREAWVQRQLAQLPVGWCLLDAGAGEQRYRQDCGHLSYVSQVRQDSVLSELPRSR